MGGFFIHSGNRLEMLARELAGRLQKPRPEGAAGWLEPEVVCVPGREMEGWLKLFLARESGIAANLEFPFPQGFIEQRVFAPLRQPVEDSAPAEPGFDAAPWSRELLHCRLLFVLESSAAAPEEENSE
jgi:exodeoxyribonuclease V gamma subunit